jgi:hypothetical protein
MAGSCGESGVAAGYPGNPERPDDQISEFHFFSGFRAPLTVRNHTSDVSGTGVGFHRHTAPRHRRAIFGEGGWADDWVHLAIASELFSLFPDAARAALKGRMGEAAGVRKR